MHQNLSPSGSRRLLRHEPYSEPKTRRPMSWENRCCGGRRTAAKHGQSSIEKKNLRCFRPASCHTSTFRFSNIPRRPSSSLATSSAADRNRRNLLRLVGDRSFQKRLYVDQAPVDTRLPLKGLSPDNSSKLRRCRTFAETGELILAQTLPIFLKASVEESQLREGRQPPRKLEDQCSNRP